MLFGAATTVGIVPGAPLKPMLAIDRAAARRVPAGRTSSSGTASARSPTSPAAGQRLYARSGVEITAAYPELAALAEQVDDALLDGEVVLLGEGGQPSFTALAERMHVRDRAEARPAGGGHAGHVHDLRPAPAGRRRT